MRGDKRIRDETGEEEKRIRDDRGEKEREGMRGERMRGKG